MCNGSAGTHRVGWEFLYASSLLLRSSCAHAGLALDLAQVASLPVGLSKVSAGPAVNLSCVCPML